MFRLNISLTRIVLALALCLALPSHAQMTLTGAGGTKAAAVAYTGPGDIVAFTHWYGLRAYNAAYATGSNPAVDLVDQAGANTITINILATGKLDVASISTWVTAHSVTTIKLTKLYDQVGTAHMTQATLANMPSVVLSGLGSLPIVQMSSSGPQSIVSANVITQTQPFTLSSVMERTGATGLQQIFGNGSANGALFFDGANTVALFAGSTADVPGANNDNAWHAFQGVFNSSSSSAMVDGTNNTGLNPGTAAFSSNSLSVNSGSFPYTGNWVEGGLSSGIMSGGNQTSLNSNQHSFWGF